MQSTKTTWVALAALLGALASGAGCIQLVGLNDLPPAPDLNGADAGPEAQGESDGTIVEEDGATSSEGDGQNGMTGCVAGGACQPDDCETGQYVCSDAGRVCSPTGPVSDGKPCGMSPGSVCSGGKCGACNAGGDCSDPMTPCVKKTLDCTSGASVCKVATNLPDGTSCNGTDYCSGGACEVCKVGNPCSPSTNPCHLGMVTSCTAGVLTCTDQNSPVKAGTACQMAGVSSGVCDSQGTCSPCIANSTCTPTGQPCQSGTMSCANGPVCGSPNNINEGKPCGTGEICSSGACVACNATSCPSGCCDSTGCVTTAQSATSCGGKGAACVSCPAGTTCMSGSGCACMSPNPDSCGGVCTNRKTDVSNCGSCGNDCTKLAHVSGPVTCNAGVCSVPPSSCAAGWSHCPSDPDPGCDTNVATTSNCGSCGNACPSAAPICSATTHTCATGCQASELLCNGTCTNVGSDSNNCGQCNNPCTVTGESCVGGNCQCASGLSPCGGSCVNESNDSANCAVCGFSCSSSQRCVGGKCVCNSTSCPSGCCSGTICEPLGSQANSTCGSGGTSCVDCTAQTGTGQTTCNAQGKCVCPSGTLNDNNNCGRCGNACGTGGSCVSGACHFSCSGSATATCNCTGTMTRTCDTSTGTWSAYSPCAGGSNTLTDVHHCGTSCSDCTTTVQHASGTYCNGGGCDFMQCQAYDSGNLYTDCNAVRADGCEVTPTDVHHCGSSCTDCMPPNATNADYCAICGSGCPGAGNGYCICVDQGGVLTCDGP